MLGRRFLGGRGSGCSIGGELGADGGDMGEAPLAGATVEAELRREG